jgi:transcriptional regulator with XRE-family HTH domain
MLKSAPIIGLVIDEDEEIVAKRKSNGSNGAGEAGAEGESFGRRLARIRRARGYSQYDLADELGISQRMVAYYEAQTERPPAHLLPKLAEILDASADELLGISDLKDPQGARNSRLWRKLRQVEKLPPSDRRALLKMLDALLAQRGA